MLTVGKKRLPQERARQMAPQYQVVSLENIHVSNII